MAPKTTHLLYTYGTNGMACGAKASSAATDRTTAVTCAKCRATTAFDGRERHEKHLAFVAAVEAAEPVTVATLIREGATAPIVWLVQRGPQYELHGHVAHAPRYAGKSFVLADAAKSPTQLKPWAGWAHYMDKKDAAKIAFESIVRDVRAEEAERDERRCALAFQRAADARVKQLFGRNGGVIAPAMRAALDQISAGLGFSTAEDSGILGNSTPSTLGCVTEEQAEEILATFWSLASRTVRATKEG